MLRHDGRVVIVGAGQAGAQLAISLRQEGFAGSITMIGAEPGLPYGRPPLSKGYLADGRAERLLLKPAAFYEQNAIVMVPATRATAIERQAAEGRPGGSGSPSFGSARSGSSGSGSAHSGSAHSGSPEPGLLHSGLAQSGLADPGPASSGAAGGAAAVVTEAGARYAYDHLVLAAGARPARPASLGIDPGAVAELRTLADAAAIRRLLSQARSAVVIGGGFIGLEFAAHARGAGLAVTVVEACDRLMARVVSPAISARFLAAHREWGSRVMLEAPAWEVRGDGTGGEVILASGERVAADIVLLATGVVPNAELAAKAGLAVENGVAVDGQLLTCDRAISAIGDCASFPGASGQRLRLESVQAAVDHARHVARRLVRGPAEPYAAVPWFWSDQGPLKLQIAGLPDEAEEWMALPPDGLPEVVIGLAGGRLVAVETVSAPGAHMAARRLLARAEGVRREALAAARYDLRALAKPI